MELRFQLLPFVPGISVQKGVHDVGGTYSLLFARP